MSCRRPSATATAAARLCGGAAHRADGARRADGAGRAGGPRAEQADDEAVVAEAASEPGGRQREVLCHGLFIASIIHLLGPVGLLCALRVFRTAQVQHSLSDTFACT